MKYLLIEDCENKAQAVKSFIQSQDTHSSVEVVDNLSDARIALLTRVYDLIIFDIYLPLRRGESEQDIADEIVADFARSKNYSSEAIAITKYADDAMAKSSLFNDNGVTLVNYAEGNEQWKESLVHKINRIAAKGRLDFIIFCALIKERAALGNSSAVLGELKQVGGLNCQEVTIDSYRGVCVVPSRMGLVNMAIAATKAIELFGPKIVAMSGICAGVSGESNFLDVVVGDICWEYQTGKYKDGMFKQEPYQVPINSPLKTDIQQLTEKPDFISGLKSGLFESELKNSTIRIGPISSGSVVVADATKMEEIGMQHRKWAALEMEMYALYEAAAQSAQAPLYFGAKAVVDMGDSHKGDALHATACTISARFVVEVLKRKLPTLCGN